MFDHYHYVPVLKWKRGERIALRKLPLEIKMRITPLVELVPDHFKQGKGSSHATVEEILQKKADELQNDWGQLPFFLDMQLVGDSFITSDGRHPLLALSEALLDRALHMIPVTGLNRPASYSNAVSSILSGTDTTLCLRVTAQELELLDLNERISKLLTAKSRSLRQVHLTIDYQFTPDNTPNLLTIQKIIDKISNYCTYTVISGAFPKDLTEFEKNKQHTLSRSDWVAWRDQTLDASPLLVRIPTFGDYTILHPHLTTLPYFPNVSASIRYTHDNYWVIMRGEGLRNEDGPGWRQYPAQASLLCDRDEYCGADFSAGDNYLHELSQQIGSSKGTPEALIQVGVNHHITYVVGQLADMFATASTPSQTP